MDTIANHIKWYGQAKKSPVMFVHLDKTVYVNNDVIWFSAYLLGTGTADLPKHEVLSASLINANNQTVAIQRNFIMHGGMAFGEMMVPDTVAPGHYNFTACTNRLVNGKPEVVFTQAVTIKSAEAPAFNVDLTLDTLYKDPLNIRILLQANTKTAPLNEAGISYYLGKNQRTRIAGKAKTSLLGSSILLIPKNHITPEQHNLEVQVKFNKEVKTLHLNIPIKKTATDVKFYPEGGYLVYGLRGRVGWEVKTAGGTAIKTSAILYANGKSTDTVETDSYGLGVFKLLPQATVKYTLKLISEAATDSVYNLPLPLQNGAILRAANAIVNDTLNLQLQNSVKGKVSLIVHNYRQVFIADAFVSSPTSRDVKIDLSTVPRGLNAITILDSLQRPLVERMFFAHYDQKPTIAVNIDNIEPGTRQKIHVKLKLNGINGAGTKGIVSVACVQDNRFVVKNDNNIEHYVYLQSELDNLPVKDDLMGNTDVDRRYLNEVLLVRGWNKYTWPEMIKSSENTIKKQDSVMYGGLVTYFLSPLKKPVQLVMVPDSSFNMSTFATTAKGTFLLDNADLYRKPEKKVRLIVSGYSGDYMIKVDDPYIPINKNLAKNIDPVLFEEPITQTTKEFALTGFEHATKLREVKITAANNNFMHGFGTNANACGDYVCKYRILNCRNHQHDPDNHPPSQGEMVMQPGIGLSPYFGCSQGNLKAGMLAFDGIYAGKEFYGADYAQINPTEPDYLSTICWKHGVLLNSEKETEISFYTSDITGKFRIVVQGVTNTDVVYGESSFNVRKKAP